MMGYTSKHYDTVFGLVALSRNCRISPNCNVNEEHDAQKTPAVGFWATMFETPAAGKLGPRPRRFFRKAQLLEHMG